MGSTKVMNKALIPGARPRITLPEVAVMVAEHELEDEVCLLGLRGYYRDTMGEVGKNDRAIYDDAIVLYSPSRMATYNANTDPGAYRPGIATLLPGIWTYKLGIHGLTKPKEKRYTALVQATVVKVARDEGGPEFGFFGINIHRGGYSSVSSLGCQTIYPNQWPEFITLVESQLRYLKQATLRYVLKDVTGAL